MNKLEVSLLSEHCQELQLFHESNDIFEAIINFHTIMIKLINNEEMTEKSICLT